MNVSFLGVRLDSNVPAAGHETRSSDTSPAAVLPDPQLAAMVDGSDLGAAVAAMVMMTAKESKKAARAARDASYAAMEAAQRDQLAHMRDGAKAKLVGGLVSGGSTIASGACSIGAGLSDAKVDRIDQEIARAGKDASGNRLPPTSGQILARQDAKTDAAFFNGGAKGLEGAGKIAATLEGYRADRCSEEEKADAMRAETAKRAAEASRDDVDDAKDVMKKAIDFYKEYTSAKNDAQKAALLRA